MMRRTGILAVAVGLGACGGDRVPPGGSAGTSAGSSDDAVTGGATTDATDGAVTGGPSSSTGPATTGSGGDPTGGADTTGGDSPAAWIPSLLERELLCKIVSDTALEDPTENALQTRFNLTGSDLGVPAALGDTLYLFFGDTVGYRAIWDFGEDPDAVGHLPLAAVQADPTTLCRDLAFHVTPDIPSVAAGLDPTIERDFAGAWLQPPPGEPIAAYIADPAGPFPNMPGTFEVPGGALAVGDALYIFYAGLVEFQPRTRATLGFLARWDAPGSGTPTYQIVRPVDATGGGPLGGHFVQIAPVLWGDHVVLFGTGDYRRSPVSLARVPTDALESGAGTEVWDAGAGTWLDAATSTPAMLEAAAPIFETEGVGELSVQWIGEAGVLVAMYQRELHDDAGNILDNRIVVRTATAPEGPWSDAVTVIDMADPAFTAAHCCGATCPGPQILHCNLAGLYGAYLVPAFEVSPAGPGGALELELPFVASTWNPYNVVLFTTRIRLDPERR